MQMERAWDTSEHSNYCILEKKLPFWILLRIAVSGLFIFRGGAIYSQAFSKTYKPFHISSWRLVFSWLVRTSQRISYSSSLSILLFWLWVSSRPVQVNELLNYCRFESLLRIAVWGLFIFRGGAIFFFKNTVIGNGTIEVQVCACVFCIGEHCIFLAIAAEPVLQPWLHFWNQLHALQT